jgi:hypothetical protein
MDGGHALELGRNDHVGARGGRLAAWLWRPRRRREVDALLRSSRRGWEHRPAVAWRVAELTSPRERRALAGTFRSIVGQVRDSRAALTASVLARRRLGPHAAELELLADRIGNLDRPVSGAGIVLVRDLLTNGAGPLYIGGDAEQLSPAIARILDLLEVH